MSLNDLANNKINELLEYNGQLRVYIENQGYSNEGQGYYTWKCEPLGLQSCIWINDNGTIEFKLTAITIEEGELTGKCIDHRTLKFTRADIDECVGETENAIEMCQILVM